MIYIFNIILNVSFIVFLGDTRPINDPVVLVSSSGELRAALASARPGQHILMNYGTYSGGLLVDDLKGRPGRPIVIAGADPRRKPVIRGGGDCLKLTGPAFVELRDLILEGSTGIGLHIDDGGTYETPAHHVRLVGLEVRRAGTDAIKMTGVDDFRIEQVTIEDWQDPNWCGINLLGCHDGVVSQCVIRNRDDRGIGIQMKGGCTGLTIQANRFEHAGLRAIQIGGSTGLAFFRPEPRGYEARDILVTRNVVIGSEAAIAFVNSRQVSRPQQHDLPAEDLGDSGPPGKHLARVRPDGRRLVRGQHRGLPLGRTGRDGQRRGRDRPGVVPVLRQLVVLPGRSRSESPQAPGARGWRDHRCRPAVRRRGAREPPASAG